MMKKKYKILSILLALVILGSFTYYAADKYRLKDKVWLSQNVSVINAATPDYGYQVIRNEKEVSYLNMDYQQTVTNKINALLKKNKYTLKKPLIILNPYGTNNCSVNVYFNTAESGYVTYHISSSADSYPDFSKTLYNEGEDNLTKNHAYVVMGLIPSDKNILTLSLYDRDNSLVEEASFSITMPALESKIETQLSTDDGISDSILSDGLFCLLGHDKAFNSNIYMYDNHGILRGEIPLAGYRTDRIFEIDGDIVFSYDDNKIAFMDNLGRITRKYKFSGYELHHDFIYDEKNYKILMLATKLGEYSIEDIVLSLNLNTGKTTELIDFKELMPEAYENAVLPKDKKQLDWIHFNTIDVIDGKDILLSSRETSTIMRVSDVYTKPNLEYFISDKSIWKDTPYENLVYDKVGDFTAQAGQHTVTYVPDSSLEKGQYYLHMYNNNLAYWPTNPAFKWTSYKGCGTTKKGDASKYYKYLVDENERTYTLVKSFDIPYSPFVSSTQEIGTNYVTSSGFDHSYGEYDSDGEMIRGFTYESEKYTYRVFKYNFENFWFINK